MRGRPPLGKSFLTAFYGTVRFPCVRPVACGLRPLAMMVSMDRVLIKLARFCCESPSLSRSPACPDQRVVFLCPNWICPLHTARLPLGLAGKGGSAPPLPSLIPTVRYPLDWPSSPG